MPTSPHLSPARACLLLARSLPLQEHPAQARGPIPQRSKQRLWGEAGHRKKTVTPHDPALLGDRSLRLPPTSEWHPLGPRVLPTRGKPPLRGHFLFREPQVEGGESPR